MICASRNWGQRHSLPDRIEALQDVIAPTSRLRLFLERHVLSSGPMPAPALEVDNLSMVRSLVVAGFGCALLPSGMVEREGQVRRLRPNMPLGSPQIKLAFPTRADMIPRVRAFADHLVKVLRGA